MIEKGIIVKSMVAVEKIAIKENTGLTSTKGRTIMGALYKRLINLTSSTINEALKNYLTSVHCVLPLSATGYVGVLDGRDYSAYVGIIAAL